MNILQMQEEILRLKKQRNIAVLAHSYQRREIVEIADFTGDSYALAQKAKASNADAFIMCGVRFMAETVKILSPQKTVYLSNGGAGCPMAEQLDIELLSALKAEHPNAVTAAYINTTAELKTLCDVCVTSSSAVRILRALPEKEILFVPDINLGRYVASQIPEKRFYFYHGGCPVHARVTREEALEAKRRRPNALLLVHPECRPEVTELADYVGSTSGIMDYAKKSGNAEFIIGTENAIVEHLQFECPEKKFYPLSKDLLCVNMKLTTLSDVLACCRGEGEEILIDEPTRLSAKRCLDRMITLGG
ncbi:MAG: quinolinate synthase NadA [Clostridia bacterium]|nr:quinolinate synthase NadA [Clostridia bacterium]